MFLWLCSAKCVASKLMCCFVVEGGSVFGFVVDSWVGGGMRFLLYNRFITFQVLLLLGVSRFLMSYS